MLGADDFRATTVSRMLVCVAFFVLSLNRPVSTP